MSRSQVGILLGVLAVLVAGPMAATAQTEDYAEISRPITGEAISGLVTISGTATHPWFVGYDLAFAYSPNPTNTWFPLGDPARTPIVEGRLGIWDTTRITDGDYSLRLRVWLQDGSVLVVVVEGIRVRNIRAIETPMPPSLATTGPTPSEGPPTVTASPTRVPPQAPEGKDRVTEALAIGVLGSTSALGLLAAYTLVRTAVRPRWSSLRMRSLHRQVEKQARRRTRRR